MSISLNIIKDLAADFDGDTLNILSILNSDFEKYCMIILNPRNNFIISKNDGLMNSAVNHQRDVIINSNTMMQISRDYYTPEMIASIKQAQLMEN